MLYIVRHNVGEESYFTVMSNIEHLMDEIIEGVREFTTVPSEHKIYNEVSKFVGLDIASVGTLVWFESESIKNLILNTFPV